MQKKKALFIVVELVMAVLGLALGWERARPLPEPPRYEWAVWLPTGAPSDDSLMAVWVSRQVVSSQGSRVLSLSEFQRRYFEAISYGLSQRSIVYSETPGAGPYMLYFGRDAAGKVWAVQKVVSGWSPMWGFPPQPYRPESYRLDAGRGVVEMTTGYSLTDAALIIFLCFLAAVLLLPVLKIVPAGLGGLLYDFFGIRFQSPIVKDSE